LDIGLNRHWFRNGRKPPNRTTVSIQEKFGEVPFDAASEKPAQAAFEQPENGVRLWPVDIDLFEKRKGYAKVQLADLFHSDIALGLLAGKLVAREPKDNKTLVLIFIIELLKALKLWRKPALCGGVHNQDDLPFVPGHAYRLALGVIGRQLIEFACHGSYAFPWIILFSLDQR
jgi:hypothetical protein